MSRAGAILVLLTVLSGCNAATVVPTPGSITLEEAMKSVGAGLVQMHEAERGLKTGLLASEVTVTFNITASASDTKKLFVEIGAPTAAQVGGKAGGEASTTISTSRGNQITIKFTNLLLANGGTLVKETDPDRLKKLLATLEGSGVIVYMAKGEREPNPQPEPKK